MAVFPDLSTPPVFLETSQTNYKYPGAVHQLSSSTSVLKYNTACSGDTTSNRWSAIGAGPGVMVFVSSTSGGSTNANELCGIFSAMGANNALRLDGGPSSGMMVGNAFVNPLTGLASFKYGNARWIAYAVQASW
jgi:hypothetical protein